MRKIVAIFFIIFLYINITYAQEIKELPQPKIPFLIPVELIYNKEKGIETELILVNTNTGDRLNGQTDNKGKAIFNLADLKNGYLRDDIIRIYACVFDRCDNQTKCINPAEIKITKQEDINLVTLTINRYCGLGEFNNDKISFINFACFHPAGIYSFKLSIFDFNNNLMWYKEQLINYTKTEAYFDDIIDLSNWNNGIYKIEFNCRSIKWMGIPFFYSFLLNKTSKLEDEIAKPNQSLREIEKEKIIKGINVTEKIINNTIFMNQTKIIYVSNDSLTIYEVSNPVNKQINIDINIDQIIGFSLVGLTIISISIYIIRYITRKLRKH